MVTVPAAIPVTTPVSEPTVAVNTSLLLHVPAGVVLLSVVVRPGHTIIVPVIGAGAEFTVTVVVAGTEELVQPRLSVTINV